jgi:hypothetical protein
MLDFNIPTVAKHGLLLVQIETITFGQAEIRSADDPRTICHSSADDQQRSATQVQMVALMTSFIIVTAGDLQVILKGPHLKFCEVSTSNLHLGERNLIYYQV